MFTGASAALAGTLAAAPVSAPAASSARLVAVVLVVALAALAVVVVVLVVRRGLPAVEARLLCGRGGFAACRWGAIAA